MTRSKGSATDNVKALRLGLPVAVVAVRLVSAERRIDGEDVRVRPYSGNLTTITAGSETRVLDYPVANRLANVSVGGSVVTTFAWDPDNGRRIAQGPLADTDQVRYSYDAAGRLTVYANDATGVSACVASRFLDTSTPLLVIASVPHWTWSWSWS
jgi:hypothetical protein